MMTSAISALLATPSAFQLNTFFGNVDSRSQAWGFEVIVAIGMLILLYSAYCVFKAISSPQGGGGYWVKFALGFFLGGFFVFNGVRGIKNISGTNSLQDLTGTNFIFSPLANLPVHDLIHLII